MSQKQNLSNLAGGDPSSPMTHPCDVWAHVIFKPPPQDGCLLCTDKLAYCVADSYGPVPGIRTDMYTVRHLAATDAPGTLELRAIFYDGFVIDTIRHKRFAWRILNILDCDRVLTSHGMPAVRPSQRVKVEHIVANTLRIAIVFSPNILAAKLSTSRSRRQAVIDLEQEKKKSAIGKESSPSLSSLVGLQRSAVAPCEMSAWTTSSSVAHIHITTTTLFVPAHPFPRCNFFPPSPGGTSPAVSNSLPPPKHPSTQASVPDQGTSLPNSQTNQDAPPRFAAYGFSPRSRVLARGRTCCV